MVQALDDARRRARTGGSRVPPHNLDAEQSLLGAMLLSRDAIAAAVESCRAEDFYKPAHAHVFDAIITLYGRGEPADPVTVADELSRAGLLEAAGGLPALVALQAETPATTNAGRYARIVEEHALLRRLIGVAGEIAEMGYSVPEDVTAAVDQAEAMVFDIAERRVTDSLKPLQMLLTESLDRLESLYTLGQTITGVPTGYVDLDERLYGLQPSSLVIVGARPAMGKALALDTPIPTPDGWVTMGSLGVGDRVFDEAGLPCTVTYTSPVHLDRSCYRVEFDDGSSIVADAEHLWSVVDVHGATRVLTTREMVEDGACGWRIPLTRALELPDASLPVDPYVFGWWIANGPQSRTSSTVFEEILDGVGLLGCVPREIPRAYLRASAKQRHELLEGMLDSRPGVGGDGAAELVLSSRRLGLQVRELVCSLGWKAGVLEEVRGKKVRGEGLSARGEAAPGWRLAWSQPDSEAPARAESSALQRSITGIVPVESVPVRCITVDSPSHLYLAGESMVPTHNTSFALGMAAHAAVEARVPTLFFSLEMGHEEITQRLLVSEARVDAGRIRNGRLAEADWPKISQAVARLSDAPLFIDDNPNLTVMEIRAKARRLKAREGQLGLIIVDYLQLMSSRATAENRQLEVSSISRGLKVLARELEVPVVALSQLSRNLEMRADKRPVLADLRESGSLEQDADVVMFLYRDEMYNPESADRGTAEVIVAKHRNGPTGKCQLAFLDHHTRFANMARV